VRHYDSAHVVEASLVSLLRGLDLAGAGGLDIGKAQAAAQPFDQPLVGGVILGP
jgi:hypothetical protein